MKPILYFTREIGGFARVLGIGTLCDAFKACKDNSFSEVVRIADRKPIARRWAIKRVVTII